MASDIKLLQRARMELASLSGAFRWTPRDRSGAGAILRFARVRPSEGAQFQPLKRDEITPRFLDHAIGALKRWNYDIVGIDEACRRAASAPEPRRFVCLTFDGGTKDFMTYAYPVLAKHSVSATLYVPTAFPDGVGEAWWLALEAVIAHESRISLMIDGTERRFAAATPSDKQDAFDYIFAWMRKLAPSDLTFAINDLSKRHSIDLAALSRAAFLNWSDLAKLAADPNLSFGCATVNYPVLSNLKPEDALREMTMGKAVAESAFRRPITHFAFPFGDRSSFRREHVVMAEQAGFASAVSTVPGIVGAEGRTNLHALPRIAWDGRMRSLRMMRVLLSGIVFPVVKPTDAARTGSERS